MDVQYDKEEMLHAISSTIPITQVIGISIDSLTLDCTSISAPLDNNRNIHGTVFAGSLYSVGILAGWCAAQILAMDALGVRHTSDFVGKIVARSASIRYVKPATGQFVARCSLSGMNLDAFRSGVQSNNKMTIHAVPILLYVCDSVVAEMSADFTFVPEV